jgi:uncharacterized RDD family membrane protein YckC
MVGRSSESVQGADATEGARHPGTTGVRDPDLLRGPELASFGRRLAAYLVDLPLMSLAQAIVAMVALVPASVVWMATGGEEGAVANGAVAVVWLLIVLAGYGYFVAFEASSWQATPGKRLLGLRVARVDGRRPSVATAIGRNLARTLCGLTLGLGYLSIVWTRRKQGLHDLLAGTVVIRRRA